MGQTKRVQKLIAEAKERTRLRILQDKARVPREVFPTLEHIAEFFFAPELNVEHLRRAGKLSRKTARLFCDALGVGVKEYLRQHKQETAQWLLDNTDLPVGRIAEILHYSQPHNFSRDFRKWTGESAEDFRQRRRIPAEPDRIAATSTTTRWMASVGKLLPEREQRFLEWLEERFPAPSDGERLLYVPGAVLFIAGQKHAEQQAEMAWRAIRNLPPQIQHRHLRHEILCGSPAMFELLSTKSRVEGRRDPQRGVELAELALSSVEGSARVLGKTFQDIHDLALARLGNALRLAGDYAGADRAFQRAEASRESPQAKRDPRVEAEFCFLKGSLRLFQRRYDESLSLLNQAIAESESIGDTRMLLNALLQRVAVMSHQGHPEATIPDLRLAERLVKGLGEPRLELGIYQDLSTSYAKAGEYSNAAEILPHAQALCEELDEPLIRHQLQWVEGLICQGKGDLEAAKHLFQEAHAGLIALSAATYAAEIALDLAILCHRQGHGSQVLELVGSEVIPVFESLTIDREILGALKLLQESVAANDVPLAVLRHARDCLGRFLRACGREITDPTRMQ